MDIKEKVPDQGVPEGALQKISETVEKLKSDSTQTPPAPVVPETTEAKPSFKDALTRLSSPNWTQVDLPSNGVFYSKTVDIRSVKGWDEEKLMAMKAKVPKVDLGSYVVGYAAVMKEFPVEIDDKVKSFLQRSLILDFLASNFVKCENKDAWRALTIPDRLYLNAAIYFFSYGDEATVRCEKHGHDFTHKMRPYFKIKALDEAELNRYLQTKNASFLRTSGGIPAIKVSVPVSPNNLDLYFSVASGDKEAFLFGGQLFPALAASLIRVEMDGQLVPITAEERVRLLKGLDPDPLARTIQAFVAASAGRAYEGQVFYGFDLDAEIKIKCPTHGEDIALTASALLAQYSF